MAVRSSEELLSPIRVRAFRALRPSLAAATAATRGGLGMTQAMAQPPRTSPTFNTFGGGMGGGMGGGGGGLNVRRYEGVSTYSVVFNTCCSLPMI